MELRMIHSTPEPRMKYVYDHAILGWWIFWDGKRTNTPIFGYDQVRAEIWATIELLKDTPVR
jgi:hypothetical protein